mgnify:CR=1 FL=1
MSVTCYICRYEVETRQSKTCTECGETLCSYCYKQEHHYERILFCGILQKREAKKQLAINNYNYAVQKVLES